MNKPQNSKRNIAARLALAAALALAGSASATLVITTDNQNNASAFTPTWTVAPGSLIGGLSPSSSTGDFQLESAGGTSQLTDGAIGPVGSGPGPFATAGNNGGAGHEVIYTLPVSANGYNVTNITVYSGWGDNGRDAQGYNVSYSTVANPTSFSSLGYVAYNPSVGGGRPTANRAILGDSAGALIAANVAAVRLNFTAPGVENGYVGYSEITVAGTAAATVTALALVITTENQPTAASTSPTWTIETDSLVAGQSPSSSAGNFQQEGATGTAALTEGTFGVVDSVATYATCGNNGGGWVTYTLTNSVNGSDLTNIVIYSGWPDAGRDGQFYNITYSTVSAPTTFIPLTSVFFNPENPGQPSANRVAITTSTGAPLAVNVGSVKFDFRPQTGGVDNGYSGYAEIILEGANSAPSTAPPSPYLTADTLPASAAEIVGGQVIFTAAFSNTPAATLQWQVLSGGVTNDISGATTPTLTLNNLQLTDTGSYRLRAVNATNSQGVSYSAASALTVSNVPPPVNGIITTFAAQTGLGGSSSLTNFYPTWIVPTNSLIVGAIPVTGLGNYGLDQTGGDPALLTDGTFGYFNYWPNVGGSPTEVTCGVNPAGQLVTYTLPASVTGYDLTNIVVYGGWGDAGRDEQKYEVLYSTVAAPSTFNHLISVDYNPSNPANGQSATRSTLTPSTSALVKNVYAVMFNFNLQGSPPENGYEGYSEIIVSGVASAPAPVLSQDITPLTAGDVVGSQVIITAAFSGADTYQWQKNGTNIPGAMTTTLTLNNLQIADTATNSGYRLVASNASGFATSRACALTVNPVPAPAANIIAAIATQTADGATFSPTWSVVSGSLIVGQPPSSTGSGNFNDPDVNPISNGQAGGTPVLTDGAFGSVVVDGTHLSFATCGPDAGQSVTYTLTGSANGYNLTNITISGGWNDGGRDEQAFTIYYSTVANPATFNPLTSVDYNPTLGGNVRSLVRQTLTPAAGSLAANVAAVMIDFTTPAGENGYSGYNEISLFGFVSAPMPPTVNPPTVSDGNLILTGTDGTPGGSYTWLTSTNVAAPVATWTTNTTGVFDGSGAFSNGIPISTSEPARFFRLRTP